MMVMIVYYAGLGVFWLGFWIGLVQQRLWSRNVQLLFPNGCPSNMNAFWADVCLGFILEIELTIMHQLWFVPLLYIEFFVVQKKYGFLNMTMGRFIVNRMILGPITELVRDMGLTLAALAIIYICIKFLHMGIFVIITVAATTILVLADVFYNLATQSCTEGKMTPLAERDAKLKQIIDQEWDLLTEGGKPLNCYV